MWNPLRAIFQSPKAIGDIVEGGIKGIDNAFFTDQEKEAARKAMLGTVTDYMAKTTGQDITRRSLALMVGTSFLLLCFAIVMFMCFEEPNKAGELYRADLLKEFMAETFEGPFMLVMAFYFAPHLIAKFVGMKK